MSKHQLTNGYSRFTPTGDGLCLIYKVKECATCKFSVRDDKSQYSTKVDSEALLRLGLIESGGVIDTKCGCDEADLYSSYESTSYFKNQTSAMGYFRSYYPEYSRAELKDLIKDKIKIGAIHTGKPPMSTFDKVFLIEGRYHIRRRFITDSKSIHTNN